MKNYNEEQFPEEMPAVQPYAPEIVHTPDEKTPIEVIEGALDIMRREDQKRNKPEIKKPTIH